MENQKKVTDTIETISRHKWNWAGHIASAADTRWAKKMLEWRSKTLKRPLGRPQKRWTDDMTNITRKNWQLNAQD